MNVQIERRLRAIEKTVAVRQPSARGAKIIPFLDGDAAEVARHWAEVEQAVRDGFFVIRLVSLEPLEPKGAAQ